VFQAKEYVETFLSHCVRPFGNLVQLCGHNRARQRDKLAHLLEDFATLQDEVRTYRLLWFMFMMLNASKVLLFDFHPLKGKEMDINFYDL
jgi:hypothetical protein